MILVSFSPANDAFYNEANIPDKYHTIIDLYNRADANKIHTTFKNRKDFPEIIDWMRAARNNYLSFLAALSQTHLKSNVSIRDFKILNFPIYWLTAMAEKHPRNHWLYSFFLFQEFLKSNYYLNEKVVIYLNHQTICLKDVILKLNANNSLERNLSFFCPVKKKSINELFEILKRQIHSGFYTIKQSSLNTSIKEAPIQIITHDINRTFYKQFVNSDIFKSYHIAFKPINIYTLKEENINNITSVFLKYKTQAWDKINLLVCSLILFFRILFLKNQIKINNVTYPIALIKNEFFEVLKNVQVYFNMYLMYKKYFKQIKNKTLFFLEDEFYINGRIVSKAYRDAQNPIITLYGLQHGMFSESHTVYTILPEETKSIKKNDEIPLPEKFIVWGNYFKKIFDNNFKLNNEFTLLLGSPHYISQYNKYLHKLTHKNNYLLWCTTGQEQFLFELPFVLKLTNKFQLPLVIRNHPAGHINNQFIENTLKEINYTLDNEMDIQQSIINSKCVVTSAHSTVVLDCIVCNKKVFRIIFDRSDDEFTEKSELVVNLKNVEDLDNIKLTIENSSAESYNNYLYLKDNKWKEFINSI